MDILGAIFELLGAGLVGLFKAKVGFLVLMGGNVCWYLYSREVGSRGLLVVGPVFFVINVASYWRWAYGEKSSVAQG